jgi:hypothetical protein
VHECSFSLNSDIIVNKQLLKSANIHLKSFFRKKINFIPKESLKIETKTKNDKLRKLVLPLIVSVSVS